MAQKVQLLKNDSMLGPYKILRLIGEGGMGEVYEAIDESLNRRVAVKVISPALMGDGLIVKRFMAEGQALARLNHQNVVTVYALGAENGIHYIAMEYIAGKPLDQFIRHEQLSFQDVYFYMRQILDGVKTLHENGIIHRDLKPKNVIVSNENVAKLLDFGVAKTDAQIDLDLTSTGMLVGSVAYMSPEVVCGEPATVQSDIWSLGIIFYEMLFRQKPFAASNPLAVLEKIKNEGMNFPPGKRTDMPDGVRWILYKMCDKSRERRYASVADIIKDLKAYDVNRTGSSSGIQPMIDPSKRVVGNETEVLKHLVDEGFSESKAKRIVDSAIRIQEEWGDPDHRHLQLVNNVLTLKISDAAIAAARNNFKRANRKSIKTFLREKVLFIAIFAVFFVIGVAAIMDKGDGGSKSQDSGAESVGTIRLTTPGPGEVVWLNGNEPIQFQWNPANAVNITAQIALDDRFQRPLVDQKRATSPLPVLNLKPGLKYHWRLLQDGKDGKDGKPNTVASSTFVVAEISPPLLSSPAHGSDIRNRVISLRWQKKIGATTYRWQLAKDDRYHNLVKDLITSGTGAETGDLEPGTYYWRVSVLNVEPLKDLWSENRSFVVEPRAGIATPVAAQPEPRSYFEPSPSYTPPKAPPKPTAKTASKPLPAPRLVEVRAPFTLRFRRGVDVRNPASIRGAAQESPVLRWTKIRNAASYEVQVSRTPDFNVLELNEVVSQPMLKWTSARPGGYLWRVRPINSQGDKGNFSSVSRVTLILPAPVARASESRPYTLSWEPVNGAASYRAMVAKDRSFNNVVFNQRSEKDSIPVSLPDAGLYHYKVVTLDHMGQVAGPFSATGNWRLGREPAAKKPAPAATPAAVAPPNPRTVEPKAAEPAVVLGTPVVQLPLSGISIVPMDDKMVPVVFKWQKVKEANLYRIEVSSSRDFSNTLFSLTSKDAQLVMNKELPTGKIYWRMRSESPDGKSEWTKPLFFEISKP